MKKEKEKRKMLATELLSNIFNFLLIFFKKLNIKTN
jgi:hypothetical protein